MFVPQVRVLLNISTSDAGSRTTSYVISDLSSRRIVRWSSLPVGGMSDGFDYSYRFVPRLWWLLKKKVKNIRSATDYIPRKENIKHSIFQIPRLNEIIKISQFSVVTLRIMIHVRKTTDQSIFQILTIFGINQISQFVVSPYEGGST